MKSFVIPIIVAIIASVTWIFDYVKKPERLLHKHSKMVHLFVIATIWLLCFIQGKSTLDADRDMQKLHSDNSTLIREVSDLHSDNSNLVLEVHTLRSMNQKLATILSKNPTIDPTTRLGIIDLKKEFQVISTNIVDNDSLQSEWETILGREENLQEQEDRKAMEAEKLTTDKCLIVYNYAVNKLRSDVAELARQYRVEPFTDVIIPTNIPVNLVAGTIRFGTNSGWSFTIRFVRPQKITESGPPALLIECFRSDGTTQLYVQRFGDRVTTTLNVPKEPTIATNETLLHYEPIVDQWLRYLIASQTSHTPHISSEPTSTMPP